MDKMDFTQTYEKWRKMILRTNIMLVMFNFLVEVIMCFVLARGELIFVGMHEYLIKYLIVPTLFNALIIITGEIVLRRMNVESKMINYVPVVQLATIGLVIAMTHYIFSVTLCLLCFPIFVTIIFVDKKMTYRVTGICIVALVITIIHRYIDCSGKEMDITIPEGIVAIAIILSTNILCATLIKFQNQKDKIIFDLYRNELAMQELLNKDQKTGLYAESAFNSVLWKCANDENERGIRPVLAILDIDDFKKINDTYGHMQGNKIILKLAELMKKHFKEDCLARFAGEEFAIIVKEKDIDVFYNELEELRREFEKQKYEFIINETRKITISIGVAILDRNYSDEEWFNYADVAMRYSKKNNKNQTTIWKDGLCEPF